MFAGAILLARKTAGPSPPKTVLARQASAEPGSFATGQRAKRSGLSRPMGLTLIARAPRAPLGGKGESFRDCCHRFRPPIVGGFVRPLRGGSIPAPPCGGGRRAAAGFDDPRNYWQVGGPTPRRGAAPRDASVGITSPPGWPEPSDPWQIAPRGPTLPSRWAPINPPDGGSGPRPSSPGRQTCAPGDPVRRRGVAATTGHPTGDRAA